MQMAKTDRRQLAAANRWHGRKKGTRSRLDKLRCHEQAMRHLWAAIGRPDKLAGPLL
jgi:hypothetical protein